VILNHIDPEKKIFDHRFYRGSCVTEDQKLFIKDLRVLKNRDLKDVVLVDNAAYSYAHQISNGIPIIPFSDDKTDTEFEELTEFLMTLLDLDDVRPYLSRYFKFREIQKYGDPY